MISNTLDQAADSLSQVKSELQSNPRLLDDFPEACEPPGSVSGAPRWRRDEIITRNGIKVTALGADKKIRGRRHRENRPTLIILDDIENEVEVRSPEQRRHKDEWFTKAVLKAGSSQTNVIVIGTVLHYDALLARLVDPKQSAGWTGRVYRAVLKWSNRQDLWSHWEAVYSHLEDHKGASGPAAARRYLKSNRRQLLAGTKVLWPQREGYEDLMEIRLTEGRASFDSEKQNEPVNPDECYFQESDLHFWEDEYTSLDALLAAMEGHCRIFGACDPSLGREGRSGDDSAIVSVLRDTRTGALYVIDADIRRRKPDAIIRDVIEFHRLRKYQSFIVETNQFQEFLADELRRKSALESAYVPVKGKRNTADKLGRIQSLQPLISSGTLRLSRRHVILVDQLRQFPMAAHDDGPDALEMAVSAAARAVTSHSPAAHIGYKPDPRRLYDGSMTSRAHQLYSGLR